MTTPTDLPPGAVTGARVRLALSIRHLEQELAMSRTQFVPVTRAGRGKGLRTKSARLRAERRAAGVTSRTRKAKTQPATVDADA